MSTRYEIFLKKEEDNSEENLTELIRTTAIEGKLIEKLKIKIKKEGYEYQTEEEIFTLAYPDGNICNFALIHMNKEKNCNEILYSYPYIKSGIDNLITIEKISEDDIGIEGILDAYFQDSVYLSLFDSQYFKNKTKYELHKSYKFNISAIAYSIEEVPESETEIKITNPDTIEIYKACGLNTDGNEMIFSLKHVNMIFSSEKDNGDSEFQTYIEDIEILEFLGNQIYKIKCGLTKTEDEQLMTNLYISERVIKDNYIPKVGDIIRGFIWVQGYLVE